MFIDLRSTWILEELVTFQGHVSISFIMEKYSVSARQIDYSLNKINDYLSLTNGNTIKKSNGELISNFDVQAFYSTIKNSKQSVYIFSEEERSIMMILLLVGQTHQISLQDFIVDLNISKNTALKSLKSVKMILETYDLELRYSRAKGYLVLGNEYQIRLMIRNLVDAILKDEIKKNFILSLLNISLEVENIWQKINLLEERLGTVYTDGRRYSVALLMAIFLRRIDKGLILINFSDLSDIKDTLEYQEITDLFFDKDNVPSIELAYLTLCILSIDISKMNGFSDVEIPELRTAIFEVISLFEKKACVFFSDHNSLVKILLQHLKPAYYRMRYSLNLSKSFDETLLKEAADKEFGEVYQMVEASLEPLEKFFEKKLPTQEIRLLTLIFAGELKKKKLKPRKKIRAAVICSEGISISRILYITLSQLIPEIEFLKPLSIKELSELKDSEYELIISPFYIATAKKLVVIDPLITRRNGLLIREKILNEIYDLSSNQVNVDEILNIIRKSATVKDEQKLRSQLNNYLYMPSTEVKQSHKIIKQVNSESPNIADLISKERIQKIKKVANWQEALQIVAKPLENEKIIESKYVERIINNYQQNVPHIVFGKEIAIPHANYEEAVNAVGMSMLIIEEGVTFSETQHVHIVILLATPDKSSHLNAMLQLLDLSVTDDDVNQMIQESSANHILSILEKYH